MKHREQQTSKRTQDTFAQPPIGFGALVIRLLANILEPAIELVDPILP